MRNISPKELHPADAAEAFGKLLTEIGRRRSLRDPIAATCEDLKLTAPQFHTVGWLGQDGTLTRGELSRRIGVTEKTMTGIIDRLTRDGLVERVRSGQDRRMVHVRLTARGKKGYVRVRAVMQERLTKVMAILDNEDRVDLLRILQKLHDRMSLFLETENAQ